MKFENKTDEKIKVQKDLEVKFGRSEWQTVRPDETIECNSNVFAIYYAKAGLTDISDEPEKVSEEVPKEEVKEAVVEEPAVTEEDAQGAADAEPEEKPAEEVAEEIVEEVITGNTGSESVDKSKTRPRRKTKKKE